MAAHIDKDAGWLDIIAEAMEGGATDHHQPHVVLLSSPGLGHLIPTLELGKRLVTLHNNLKVTIFYVSLQTSAAESDVIESTMSSKSKLYEVIKLPSPDISDLVHADDAVLTQLAVFMREIKPAFLSAISALSSPPTLLVVDVFGNAFLEIDEEIKIPKFIFYSSNAWSLAMVMYLPILDKLVKGEYVDEEVLFIPGCKPIQPGDLMDSLLCRSDQQYLDCVNLGMKIPMADGILVNTWKELEPSTLATLRDDKLLGQSCKVPIYPVGPLTKPTGTIGSNKKLFDWLDKQPNQSVVFVSFGSGGVLSKEQMRELAWGLELSQQRFIWVVRTPAVKSGDGSFFTVGSGINNIITSYLPEGFMDRTKNVGYIVLDWAPQAGILSHPAVGGFLSHCGWNSILESITNGVPLIAWALYAEQKMNATFLEEELGIAVRSKTLASKGFLGREEIKMMIKKIMVDDEGKKMRARVKDLKLSAENALTKNGSSSKALGQVISFGYKKNGQNLKG